MERSFVNTTTHTQYQLCGRGRGEGKEDRREKDGKERMRT